MVPERSHVNRILTGGINRPAQPAKPLAAGTQLVREWNGRVYRVAVTSDGFEMDGLYMTAVL